MDVYDQSDCKISMPGFITLNPGDTPNTMDEVREQLANTIRERDEARTKVYALEQALVTGERKIQSLYKTVKEQNQKLQVQSSIPGWSKEDEKKWFSPREEEKE